MRHIERFGVRTRNLQPSTSNSLTCRRDQLHKTGCFPGFDLENVRAMVDQRADAIRDAALRPVELHPAKRWSALVGLALGCTYDLTTVGAWAREAGMCETQLRLRCRLAGVPAKVSLDFVRVLRAARWREARGGSLEDYLDVGDPRTLRRLLARAGLSGPEAATVVGYVSAQRVIRNVALIEELEKVLLPMATVRQNDGPHP